MAEQPVTIYSTPTCHFCHMTKDFLKEHSIPFTDYNVAENMEKRQEMVQMTGQMGVPVIVIGSEIIIGFDQKKLSQLLSIQ